MIKSWKPYIATVAVMLTLGVGYGMSVTLDPPARMELATVTQRARISDNAIRNYKPCPLNTPSTTTPCFPATYPDIGNALAEQFHIAIIWTTDWRNCGATPLRKFGGCWRSDTPNTVYIAPGMEPHWGIYVLRHEIGHAILNRLGAPNTECAADRFAQSLGSDRGYYCPPVN